MSAALGLLVLGATVVVHLEDVRGLDGGEALALASEVARVIEARTATAAVVDDPAWGRCEDAAEACLAALRARSGASEIVLLRAFAAGARVRVTIERVGSSGLRVVDLGRAAAEWRGPLAEAVAGLFAAGVRRDVGVAAPSVGPSVGPYVLAGSGVVALAVGIALGAASASTLDGLEAGPTRASIARAEEDAARGQAVVANVLFGVAGAAVVGGLVWWWMEE